MNPISRTVVAACAAVAVLAPTATVAVAVPADAVHAKAAAKKYTVAKKLQKAKLGVCKVSKGTKWKVYGRLDTRKASTGTYTGVILVTKKGRTQPVALNTSRKTKKGKLVALGSVVVPKKGGYAFGGGIGVGNKRTGGAIKLSKVRRC